MEYILKHQGRSFLLSLIATTLFLIGQPLAAQTTTLPEQLPRPVLNSNKLSSTPILDGNILSDIAWNGADAATNFTQIQPNEGAPATQKTEVYIGILIRLFILD